MARTVPLFAVFGTLVLLSLACGGDDGAGGPDASGVVIISTSEATKTPRPSPTKELSPTPSPTPLEICSPNPDPAPPAVLQVEAPAAGEKMTIPVHVRGWSSNIGEEGKVVFIAVVDQEQKVLQMNQVPAQPRDFRLPPAGLGVSDFTRPFAIDILLDDVVEETPYCIWVYQEVDGAGRARGVVQIPITVEPS
jgi:hypothetical protein